VVSAGGPHCGGDAGEGPGAGSRGGVGFTGAGDTGAALGEGRGEGSGSGGAGGVRPWGQRWTRCRQLTLLRRFRQHSWHPQFPVRRDPHAQQRFQQREARGYREAHPLLETTPLLSRTWALPREDSSWLCALGAPAVPLSVPPSPLGASPVVAQGGPEATRGRARPRRIPCCWTCAAARWTRTGGGLSCAPGGKGPAQSCLLQGA